MEIFKKAVKKRLKERSMNFGELAEKVNMSHEGLMRSIDNDTLKLVTYKKVCSILGLDIHEFMEDGYNKPDEEGIFSRMLTDVQSEMNKVKVRSYKMEDLLRQNGLSVNFRLVSKYFASCGRRFFYVNLSTNLLTFQAICL